MNKINIYTIKLRVIQVIYHKFDIFSFDYDLIKTTRKFKDNISYNRDGKPDSLECGLYTVNNSARLTRI